MSDQSVWGVIFSFFNGSNETKFQGNFYFSFIVYLDCTKDKDLGISTVFPMLMGWLNDIMQMQGLINRASHY